MNEQFEIEVFRPGTFTPMSGAAVTYSAEDLSAIAEAYDAVNSPVPVVVGHPTTDAPAYGWAESFRYDGESARLLAKVGDLQSEFADAVRAKRYRTISLSLHKPNAPANPKPGAWYPKHIGFLGGAAPAVTGLKPVSFAGEPDEAVVVVAFGDAGFRDSAGLFRRMRDFMIEQFGLEKADAALPAYEIDWLSRRADEDAPGFTAPTETPPVTTPSNDAAFVARETALETRERILAEREASARQADNAAFCAELEKQGRLLPAKRPEVLGLLNAIGALAAPAEVSFADAAGVQKKEPVVETLKRVLKDMPVQVDFSALPREAPAGTDTTAFAAPDGHQVDAGSLDIHGKAKAYQRQNPNTAWLDAVRAVS